MVRSAIAIALLVVTAGCAHAQKDGKPRIVSSLAAATLVPVGDLGGRQLFVDEPSFLRAEQAIGGTEQLRPASIGTLLRQPVRTDLDAAAMVCPAQAMCHLQEDPFVITLENVWREEDVLRIRVHFMYNLRSERGPMMTESHYDITVARAEHGWRIVSVIQPTTH